MAISKARIMYLSKNRPGDFSRPIGYIWEGMPWGVVQISNEFVDAQLITTLPLKLSEVYRDERAGIVYFQRSEYIHFDN